MFITDLDCVQFNSFRTANVLGSFVAVLSLLMFLCILVVSLWQFNNRKLLCKHFAAILPVNGCSGVQQLSTNGPVVEVIMDDDSV